MVSAFQCRRDWVVPALNAFDGVRCENPSGAFYVFPNVAAVCERLGILEAYRASFGQIGADGEHFLRLSIANRMADIRRGIALIERAADDSDGFRAFVAEEGLWT